MNTDDLADVTNDELLWAVECGEMELPEGFPEAIVARGEEFIETLCEIVIDPDNWRGLNDVHDGWSPIHAMHLLGGIGDPAATEALLEPLRDSDWDEYFLDDGPGIFAHLGPGAVPAMQRFARDEEGDDSAVNVVVDGLQGLGILHPECAEVARSVARDLVVWALDGEEEGWLSPLYVNQLAWLRNPEDLELLREAYEAGVWGDGMFTSWEYVESVYASAPLPDDLARLTLDPMDFYSERRMAEQRAFWNGVERREAGADGYEGQRFTRVPPPTGPGPAVPKPSMWLEPPAARVVPPGGTRKPKIGRNAPCPCGSGKKYKRCCGR